MGLLRLVVLPFSAPLAKLKEARHCAVTLGMKKTSVDQLTKAVGIAGSYLNKRKAAEMRLF